MRYCGDAEKAFKQRSPSFLDIKVSALSIGTALYRLRGALWQRLRWTKVETSCAGEPISPVPQKPTSEDLTVPIEVEISTETR
jgi:hypothetical protein